MKCALSIPFISRVVAVQKLRKKDGKRNKEMNIKVQRIFCFMHANLLGECTIENLQLRIVNEYIYKNYVYFMRDKLATLPGFENTQILAICILGAKYLHIQLFVYNDSK